MWRNVGLYVALRIASVVVPILPLRVAYALACTAGNCAYCLLSGPRTAIRRNLAQVLSEAPDSPNVRRRARRAFQNDAKNWVDTLRIARLTNQEILASVDVHGWKNVEGAVSGGKGLIILTMHLGNFDLVGQVVVARGLRITVPVERMRPQRLYHLLTQGRRSKGLNAVPVDQAPRQMIRALRAGEVVAIAGDRQASGRSTAVELFGRRTSIPQAPLSLARHSGAPILLGVGIRREDDRFDGFATAPIDLQRTGDSRLDDQENARRLVHTMEEFIHRFPDQWLVFSPVWPDEGPRNPAASIEHQSQAAV